MTNNNGFWLWISSGRSNNKKKPLIEFDKRFHSKSITSFDGNQLNKIPTSGTWNYAEKFENANKLVSKQTDWNVKNEQLMFASWPNHFELSSTSHLFQSTFQCCVSSFDKQTDHVHKKCHKWRKSKVYRENWEFFAKWEKFAYTKMGCSYVQAEVCCECKNKIELVNILFSGKNLNIWRLKLTSKHCFEHSTFSQIWD